jgi:hypothetical protein
MSSWRSKEPGGNAHAVLQSGGVSSHFNWMSDNIFYMSAFKTGIGKESLLFENHRGALERLGLGVCLLLGIHGLYFALVLAMAFGNGLDVFRWDFHET